MSEKISLKNAQNLLVQGQLLDQNSKTPLKVLEQLGYIQIDTISVVERAHHHVLWSRCPKYKKTDLDKLIKSRKAFEYWSHAAAYLPMKDYRYSLYRKDRFKRQVNDWGTRDKKVMKYVYDRIKAEGPLQSKDFKSEKGASGGWWQWKPAKQALERLFFEGELEISERVNFQKVFDLSERVIPAKVNRELPTDEEHARYLIRRTLDHHIFATAKEMAYLLKGDIKKSVSNEVKCLVEDSGLIELEIEGQADTYYIRKKHLKMGMSKTKHVHILSPFDNLVIQRQKLSNLFGFDYLIECYVPEPKRKFGYFCLPILVDRQFVGRIDCKVDRKQQLFNIQSLHWEKADFEKKHKRRVMQKLAEFATFNSSSLA